MSLKLAVKKMIDYLSVTRYFIIRAYEDGIEAEMTNMKLQKLLYYAQSLHLALYNRPLFDEEIQAWRYGPVCPPAYKFYSEFEAEQLPVPNREELLQITPEKKELLEEVWEYFGGYNAYRLSDMTHGEFPWKKARRGLPPQARSREPILLDDMKELGKQKLDRIERDHPAYEPIMTKILQDALAEESSKSISKGEIGDWLNSLLD